VDPGQFRDPKLRGLAQALPGVLICDKAPNTVTTYLAAYKSWERWAQVYNLCSLPADNASLALYLVSLIQQDRSVSSINSTIYGVDWVHKKNGYDIPSRHPLLQQVAEAARRILARPKSRKTPLTGEAVTSILNRLRKGSIADLQVAALFALGFFGFLRWDDLSRLTPENLVFAPTHLAVNLEKRKNDQFREGSQILIARSEGAVCPVAIVEKFLQIGGHDRQMVIWRRVQKTKNGVRLRAEAMSYSRASELVKKEIKAEGLDPKQYGLHSLRSGGASTAAAAGISDRLLQRQGGWHTATAKNNYISESLDTLLKVTKSMQTC